MFELNDYVSLKNNPKSYGIIVDIKKASNETYYTVRFNAQDEIYAESQLMKYQIDYLSTEDKIKKELFVSLEDFKRNLLLAKIHFNLSEVFYEANSSTADFLPHQFRPVMKILNSDTGRLLIADEVGVGKTIETGYIISELLARNEINSILIICPKNLIPKWHLELKRFFNEDFEKANDSKDLFLKLENRSKYPKLIVGLELIRRTEIVNQIAQGLLEKTNIYLSEFKGFDLIVFDEAHHLRNTNTLSHKIGKILLDNCEYALFLTATPINTKLEDLMNLLNLLVYQGELTMGEFNEIMEPNKSLIKIQNLLDYQPSDYINSINKELNLLSHGNSFSRLIYERILTDGNLIKLLKNNNFRTPEQLSKIRISLESINLLSNILNNTRKRDIADAEQLFPIRHPENPILIQFSNLEQKFYQKAREFFIQLIIRKSKGFVPVQLVEVMPQRIVASSIHGTIRKLHLMLKRHKFEIEYEDQDFQEEFEENPYILTENEINKINELLEYEEKIGPTDSKFDIVFERIKEYLLAGNDQIVIFSYFKLTIEYITDRLNRTDFSDIENLKGRSIRVEYIHGDIDDNKRELIFNQFRENKINILVLSEIGAEGIDLQHNCNCLINYDLPWNPMKLEQRIGRLDRYGQKKPIFITNVYIKNSIEDRILHRLYERIEIVRENLIFLNPILEEYFITRREFFYKPERSEDEIEEILNKIEENLNSKKIDMEKIEERIDELKGQTGKALIIEEEFIRQKKNPFSLKEFFEALSFTLSANFSETYLEKCNKDKNVLDYLNLKKIPNSESLYFLKTNENFLQELLKFEITPESVKQQVNEFINQINDSLHPKLRRYKPLLFTYDVDLASKYRDFINLFSLKNILAKILLKLLEEKKSIQISQCTVLKPNKNAQFNSKLIRIYLLKIEGLRSSAQIEMIGYDFITNGIILKDECNQTFQSLSLDQYNVGRDKEFDNVIIKDAFEKCFTEIVSRKNSIEKEQNIKLRELYKYKKEQIVRKYDNIILNLNNTLDKVKAQKIERLYRGQISRNQQRKEEALNILEKKYNQSIHVSIVDIGAILIGKMVN